MQCGHYVTRGHMATRYTEENSSMQCRGCNYNGGQHLKHAAALDVKWGAGSAKRMEALGAMPCKRSAADLWAIAARYRGFVEGMQG